MRPCELTQPRDDGGHCQLDRLMHPRCVEPTTLLQQASRRCHGRAPCWQRSSASTIPHSSWAGWHAASTRARSIHRRTRRVDIE